VVSAVAASVDGTGARTFATIADRTRPGRRRASARTILSNRRAWRWFNAVRTMYRILAAAGAVRERRNQLRHPAYTKPEFLATAPNQVWSWDITKLKGPVKWTYYYLYVVLDIYSRHVVGWTLAARESGTLARQLIEASCEKQGIAANQLTVHADRGPPMISRTLALKLADLGVTKSHSRPYTSNDNPFSESQFRTMKYRPDFPARFGSIQDARAHCRAFFEWYNRHHRHSSLGLLTPETVRYGRAEAAVAARSVVLDAAYRAHPERFVRRAPAPPALPTEVWINPPVLRPETEAVAH
jgi:putative transposase